MLVAGGLRVVALQPAVLALDQTRVEIGGVDRALRRRGRRVRLGNRVRSQSPAPAIDALGPVALIGLLRSQLARQLLVHPPLGLADARAPVARDRRGLLGAPVIQPPPGRLEPLLAPVGGRQLGRQLVTAAIPEALVLL